MIRTSISLAVLVVLAVPAAQAAPTGPRVHDSIPVNKIYEILHPEDKVGPPVDPSGPLVGPIKQVIVVDGERDPLIDDKLEPDADPWFEQVGIGH